MGRPGLHQRSALQNVNCAILCQGPFDILGLAVKIFYFYGFAGQTNNNPRVDGRPAPGVTDEVSAADAFFRVADELMGFGLNLFPGLFSSGHPGETTNRSQAVLPSTTDLGRPGVALI